MLFRLGSEKTLVRRLAKIQDTEELSIAIFNSLYLVITCNLISATLIYFILREFSTYRYSFDTIVVATLFSFLLFFAHVLRSQGKIGTSIFFAGIFVPSVLIFCIILFGSYFPNYFRLYYVLLISTGIAATLIILRGIIPDFRPHVIFYVDRSIMNESIGSLVHTFAVVGMQHIPILLIGASFASASVAEFQYAVMFSMLIGVLPLALSATFEVSFSKTGGDIVKVRECRSKLRKSVFKHLVVLFPFVLIVGCALYFYGLVGSIYLLVCVVVGQLLNLMSIQYQAEYLMIWDVRVAARASIFGFATAAILMFVSINIAFLLRIEVFATCVSFGYLIKFLFLHFNRR